MPKKIFWPAAMITMGLIFLASSMGMLSHEFWALWPVILIVVGLGGLLTADREEWLWEEKKSAPMKSKKAKTVAARSSKTKKKN